MPHLVENYLGPFLRFLLVQKFLRLSLNSDFSEKCLFLLFLKVNANATFWPISSFAGNDQGGPIEMNKNDLGNRMT